MSVVASDVQASALTADATSVVATPDLRIDAVTAGVSDVVFSSDLQVEAVTNDLATPVCFEVVQREIVTVGYQAFSGPDSGGASSPAQIIDITGNRYHYAGYASRICRIDYASYPAVIQNAVTSNLNTDWPNRGTLIYA